MIRFRFKLRPLTEVALWGGLTGPATLHWFGLTDGWYWIEVGGLQLLRYSRDTSDRPAATEGSAAGPYADYYVARLWEDLLEVHPSAVEPVPDDLVAFLRWRPEEWPTLDDADASAAEEWLWSHDLDQGHLINAPWLRLWTGQDGEHLTFRWEHGRSPGPRFDAPDQGEVVIAAEAFLAAVAEFHEELMATMESRVAELEREGAPPGVELDLAQLRAEQRDRVQWLGLRVGTLSTDWTRVRRGASLLMNAEP